MAENRHEKSIRETREGFSRLGISEAQYACCANVGMGYLFEQCTLLVPSAITARASLFPVEAPDAELE